MKPIKQRRKEKNPPLNIDKRLNIIKKIRSFWRDTAVTPI
jgi:hypothetical protein